MTGFRVTATTDSRHTIQRWIDVDEGRVFVGCPTQDPDKESEAMFDLPVPVGDSIIHQRTKGLSVFHSCPSVCHAVCMSVYCVYLLDLVSRLLTSAVRRICPIYYWYRPVMCAFIRQAGMVTSACVPGPLPHPRQHL